MKAKGNIVDHEYEIERDDHKVAEVSKKWFRVRDTYGIEIEPGQDVALILAVTVCIDQLTHDVGCRQRRSLRLDRQVGLRPLVPGAGGSSGR